MIGKEGGNLPCSHLLNIEDYLTKWRFSISCWQPGFVLTLVLRLRTTHLFTRPLYLDRLYSAKLSEESFYYDLTLETLVSWACSTTGIHRQCISCAIVPVEQHLGLCSFGWWLPILGEFIILAGGKFFNWHWPSDLFVSRGQIVEDISFHDKGPRKPIQCHMICVPWRV